MHMTFGYVNNVGRASCAVLLPFSVKVGSFYNRHASINNWPNWGGISDDFNFCEYCEVISFMQISWSHVHAHLMILSLN